MLLAICETGMTTVPGKLVGEAREVAALFGAGLAMVVAAGPAVPGPAEQPLSPSEITALTRYPTRALRMKSLRWLASPRNLATSHPCMLTSIYHTVRSRVAAL